MSDIEPRKQSDPDRWLLERARELRRNQTQPERRLWHALRNRRVANLKFVRQDPLGGFVVDFLCREKRLIVELDGDSHRDRAAYDHARESKLAEMGYKTLRVSNDEVLENLEGVLFAIVRAAGLDPAAWRDGKLGAGGG